MTYQTHSVNSTQTPLKDFWTDLTHTNSIQTLLSNALRTAVARVLTYNPHHHHSPSETTTSSERENTYLLRGKMTLSSVYASSHSATYSFSTLSTRTMRIVSCITRFEQSLSFSSTVTVSNSAFRRSMHELIKSSWISTWFCCRRGPRLVKMSFRSITALSATSSGASKTTWGVWRQMVSGKLVFYTQSTIWLYQGDMVSGRDDDCLFGLLQITYHNCGAFFMCVHFLGGWGGGGFVCVFVFGGGRGGSHHNFVFSYFHLTAVHVQTPRWTYKTANMSCKE